MARVLWVTLALNWVVAGLKVGVGLLTHCMVMTADGFHSFSDGTANIIGLIAIAIAGRPADKDHPYGHQKIETLASAVIAFLLFAVAIGVLRQSVLGLIHPRVPEITAASFWVMGGTLAANLFVVWYERRRGAQLGSDFLISDSWHTLTDVFVSLSVIVALIGIRLKVHLLDPLFSFGIALFILYTAVRILKHSSDVLVDKAVIEPERIDALVRAVPGVKDCHEIRTRGRLDHIHVDLHVLVDAQMTVRDSHALANGIERLIKESLAGVSDVVVHIEPHSHDHA